MTTPNTSTIEANVARINAILDRRFTTPKAAGIAVWSPCTHCNISGCEIVKSLNLTGQRLTSCEEVYCSDVRKISSRQIDTLRKVAVNNRGVYMRLEGSFGS